MQKCYLPSTLSWGLYSMLPSNICVMYAISAGLMGVYGRHKVRWIPLGFYISCLLLFLSLWNKNLYFTHWPSWGCCLPLRSWRHHFKAVVSSTVSTKVNLQETTWQSEINSSGFTFFFIFQSLRDGTRPRVSYISTTSTHSHMNLLIALL